MNVAEAIKSSVPMLYHGRNEPSVPNVDRPSAMRIMESKRSNAAAVAVGSEPGMLSKESDVAVEGSGIERCVAKNI